MSNVSRAFCCLFTCSVSLIGYVLTASYCTTASAPADLICIQDTASVSPILIIEMLVEYLKALEAAFDNLADDVVAARMDSVQGCVANRRELLHTAPPLSYISSSSSYAPTIRATARRLPTTEEFD